MIHHGDLFDVLPTLDAESIDACVTDPPYELGFMGRRWDSSGVAFKVETWREVLRVLKPGAHLVSFGGTRTFHRMTCAIEDVGFEIRDCLSWLYGQGFPKSLNLGDGRGTALKPGWEPIVLARKPTRGTVKANAERYGTGTMNIDACRIETDGRPLREKPGERSPGSSFDTLHSRAVGDTTLGRWPANVLLDEEAARLLDDMAPRTGAAGAKDNRGRPHGFADGRTSLRDDNWGDPIDERSGASRFYYVAKPSREERDYGCEGLEAKAVLIGAERHKLNPMTGKPVVDVPRCNTHPTVKPIELMRWLVKLVTPPNGTVLDPFCGSGTTGMACRYELRQFIGIEREAEYVAIAERRIAAIVPLFSDKASA